MAHPIPMGCIAAWRAQALAILADLSAPISCRRTAWRVLKQWGAR